MNQWGEGGGADLQGHSPLLVRLPEPLLPGSETPQKKKSRTKMGRARRPHRCQKITRTTTLLTGTMARTLLNDTFDMASLLSSGFCNSTEYLDILHLSGLSVTVSPLPRFSRTIHPVAYGSANSAHSWQLASREDLKNITAILESGNVSIDCPVPVCAFPISSSYASTRRIIFYCLMALCLFAPTRTTVRRLSIMGLGMYGFVSSLHFLILSFSNHSVIDYDSIPTATMTLSTLLVVIWNAREIAAFSRTSNSSSDEEEESPEPACPGGALGFALFFTLVPLYITILFLGVIIGGPPEGLPINLLRSNQGDYRITSSCYNHSVDGAMWKLWDANGSFPVRSIKEMFWNPVPYQKDVEGDLDTVRLVNIVQSTLSVLSRKAWWTGITIVGLGIIATLLIARAPACCDSETPDGQVGSIEIPIGEIFEWISERDPRSRYVA
jgi:hypothetical protein